MTPPEKFSVFRNNLLSSTCFYSRYGRILTYPTFESAVAYTFGAIAHAIHAWQTRMFLLAEAEQASSTH